MKITFRVDAHRKIGSGHIMRCMALAKGLRQEGIELQFISRIDSAALAKNIEDNGFTWSAPSSGESRNQLMPENCDNQPRFSEEIDAWDTISILGNTKPDWLVLDNYNLGLWWESEVRSFVNRILVLDDIATRKHDCDLLLNQNMSAEDFNYDELVPKTCEKLLGPKFALLKPEYSFARSNLPPRDGKVRRVLIFFGGSDSANGTALALNALNTPEFMHLELDVVLGPHYSHCDYIFEVAKKRGRVTIAKDLPHLADLMIRCDLALGAGGSTVLERLCLGLPAIVIALSENQRVACQVLSAQGYIRYLGSSEEVGVEDIRLAVREMINNEQKIKKFFTKALDLVDGRGVYRVKEKILSISA